MKKSANMIMIENCFLEIQMNKNVNKNLNDIKKLINREFGNIKCEEISINNNNNDLFGMYVFPLNSIENIFTEYVIKNNRIDDLGSFKMFYSIEIDNKLLKDKSLKMKPHELVAMLLHEIEHIRIENGIYEEMKMVFLESLKDMDINIYDFKRNYNNKCTRLGAMFMLEFIDKSNLVQRVKNSENLKGNELEIKCDKNVYDYGYGESLISVIEKFKKYFRTQLLKSLFTINNDRKISCECFIQIMQNFNSRERSMLELLKVEKERNSSSVVKDYINRIIKIISPEPGFARLSEYTDLYSYQEIVDEKYNEMFKESFFLDLFKNINKVTQKDIDELKIEKEMIEDYDDKMCLMFKIHKRMKQVLKAKSKIKDDDKYSLSTINNYEKQLSDLLDNLMKMKIEKKQIGLFVQYPSGYEG